MSSPATAEGPLVAVDADDHRLLDQVVQAFDVGRTCVVLDPRWPAELLVHAREQVRRAGARLPPARLVLFTSGSAGRPRAVVRTFASWVASLDPLTLVTDARPDDVVHLPGRLTSSLFLYGAFHARRLGAGVLTAGDTATAATLVHVVPSQLRAMVERPEAWPALRTVVVAGDVLPAPLAARARALGWRVVEYYGAAELSFVAWRDDDGPLRPFPGVQVDVRDGVVWASSAYLARGYLDDVPGGVGRGPMHTDGPMRSDGSWATVGDLAHAVPGGLQVVGRGTAVVTTGGSTVVAEEVERVLAGVEGVDDVVVVGVPDARLGEVVTAVVVTREPEPDRAALVAAVAVLPAAARPRRWYRASALPRTTSGKPDRMAARAAAVAASHEGDGTVGGHREAAASGADGLRPLR